MAELNQEQDKIEIPVPEPEKSVDVRVQTEDTEPFWKSRTFWMVLIYLSILTSFVWGGKMEAKDVLTEMSIVVGTYTGFRIGRKL
jgi:hypothetical protein